MRYAFITCFMLSVICSLCPSIVRADPPPLTGEMSRFMFADSPQSLDQISLTDLTDNDASLAQYRGKVVLVNVWATWCGPCVMEMPGLDHLSATMGSKDFAVVPVSIDRGGPHQAAPFLKRMGVQNMNPLFDHSNSIGRMLGASRIPVTLIIGRDGNEIGRLVGTADWDSDEAKALLRYFISYGSNGAKANLNQIAMTH
jgi:thiol-disulfide isomerase/thioredoxin